MDCKYPNNSDNAPDDVCTVNKYIVEKNETAFTHPKLSFGSTSAISTLFLKFSLVCSPGRYQADENSAANEEDSCRNVSQWH